MKSASKLVWVLLFLLCVSVTVWAQTTNKATGVIAGRVTIGDAGAPGIEVIATKQESGGIVIAGGNGAQTYTATTDTEGRYRIINLPAGSMRVSAFAPALVTPGERNAFNPGKTVNLAEGESAENVDFVMARGGVITGKITDEDGRLVVEEAVTAHKLDQNGKRAANSGPAFSQWQTDDRGVYRIYGLEPGRYLVSAGASSDDGMMRIGRSGGTYERTFHPEAIEEARAKIVEVTAGGEAENVDIKIARASKGYAATGRVIDADTDKPIAGVMIGYGIIKDRTSSFGMGSSATNSQGEFRLEGLSQNSYTAYAVMVGGESDSYSDSVAFEVTGGDVSGLEIKMHRGSSISGTAIVENVKDPAILANLSKVRLRVQSMGGERGLPIMGSNMGQITSSGTFKLSGLRPGKSRLSVDTFNLPKGFSLLRMERDGAEVKDMELVAGEAVTGVRLIFTYGNGSIFGRVEIKGGTLPPGARMSVNLRRDGEDAGNSPPLKFAEADSRGQFLIEGLTAGNYKVTVNVFMADFDSSRKLPKAEQIVTVAGDGRQDVSMVLDMTPQQKENDK